MLEKMYILLGFNMQMRHLENVIWQRLQGTSKKNQKASAEESVVYEKWYGWKKHTLITIFAKICYIIMRVRSACSLVASCVLLRYTRIDDVN